MIIPLYQPIKIRAILINVTYPNWAKHVLGGVEASGREISSSTIAGYPAFTFDSEDVGIPMEATYIQIDDERWVMIGVKQGYGYEETFEHFKNSLQFFPELHSGESE